MWKRESVRETVFVETGKCDISARKIAFWVIEDAGESSRRGGDFAIKIGRIAWREGLAKSR
jgi:hypothetical protein